MFKRTILVLFTVMLLVVVTYAKGNTVSGVLTNVDTGRIEIKADDQKTVTLTLSSDTKYRKWIMAKPWQQDPTAKMSDLKQGMRVRVDVEGDKAQTVWIVVR